MKEKNEKNAHDGCKQGGMLFLTIVVCSAYTSKANLLV